MIKKINNKGLTAVELIICFALVSIITIAMFSTVNSYRKKQDFESFKNTITTYKNSLTSVIYQDIIDNKGISKIDKEDSNDDFAKYKLIFANNTSTSEIAIKSQIKCYSITRENGKKTITSNQPCKNNNSKNIDYKTSEFSVTYTKNPNTPGAIEEKFDLPKIEGLKFNEVNVDTIDNGFIHLHIGLYHNDYGTSYDVLNILVPDSSVYPGML